MNVRSRLRKGWLNMTMKVDNAGFEKLLKNLQKLEKVSTQKATLRRALVKAAKPTAEKAASYAPYDDGELESSIGAGTRLSERGKAAAKSDPESKFRVNAYVGVSDDAPAAALVEFGTTERETKDGRGTGSATPQPFLRPAWDSDVPKILERLKAEMATQIDKSVARQAKRKAKP